MKYFFLFLCLSIIFIGCKKETNPELDKMYNSFPIRFISKLDSSNLLCKSSIKLENILFIGVRSNESDTINLFFNNVKQITNTKCDSVLLVESFYNYPKIFISINEKINDTILLNYLINNAHCASPVNYFVETLKHNSKLIKTDSFGVYNILL